MNLSCRLNMGQRSVAWLGLGLWVTFSWNIGTGYSLWKFRVGEVINYTDVELQYFTWRFKEKNIWKNNLKRAQKWKIFNYWENILYLSQEASKTVAEKNIDKVAGQSLIIFVLGENNCSEKEIIKINLMRYSEKHSIFLPHLSVQAETERELWKVSFQCRKS